MNFTNNIAFLLQFYFIQKEAPLYFNKDGYSKYCKEYKEYWDWVEKRNEVRYENTQSHGKNYDAKNMIHTFRLLEMAKGLQKEMDSVFKNSDLPEKPNIEFINKLTFELRNRFY